MNGYELIKKINELGPDKEIRFWNDDQAYWQRLQLVSITKISNDDVTDEANGKEMITLD